MAIYNITPNDVLFFRDARPFETGGGHGARWPDPNILFSAIHAALHRAYPTQSAEWEHKHRHGKKNHGPNDKYDNDRRDKRFGSLQTAGPFPVSNNTWYFPVPQDVTAFNRANKEIAKLLPVKDTRGTTNLPAPLSIALANTAKPSKENHPPAWWSKQDIEDYLRGKNILNNTLSTDALFDGEWVTGIGINPDSQSQDGEKIYSAEYLRLKPDVHMGATASMPLKDGNDGLEYLFSQNNKIIVGGQQRVCNVRKSEQNQVEHFLPIGPKISGNRVKWLLISPAVFPSIGDHCGGWLPSWVNHKTGEVELTDGPGKNKAKRKGLKQGRKLDVKLVAARITKPLVVNGWSERLHLLADNADEESIKRGATKTELAVAPGAVYYFEGPDASLLAARLNWHGEKNENIPEILNRRSSIYGEQGFGLGVCGPWDVQ